MNSLVKRKRVITYVFIGLLVFFTVIGLYFQLTESGFWGAIGEVNSNSASDSGEKTENQMIMNAPTPTQLPTEAKYGEPFTVSGIEVTVNSATVGKNHGALPPLSDPDSIASKGVKLDTSGNFTDNHNYVDVEVTCKNTGSQGEGDDPDGVRLNSFWLVAPDGESFSQVAEAGMSDAVDFTRLIESAGFYELAAGESVTAHIGFVLTDEQLKDLQGKLYFLPDFSGIAMQYPKEANAHWVKLDYALS